MTHTQARQRRAEIAAKVAAGTPSVMVAAEYDTTLGYVRRCCREHGAPYMPKLGPRQQMKASTYQVISKLINSDDTYKEIGEGFDITPQRVEQINKACTEAGIPVRRRR